MSHGAALAAGARLETCAAAATRGFTVAGAGPGGKPASDARAVEQCTLAGVEQVRDPLSIGHIWPMCACDGWATRPLVVARREGCASKWPQRARDHRCRLVTCGNHAVVAEVGRMASATMGGVLPHTRRYRAKGGMTEPHLYEVGASAAGRGRPPVFAATLHVRAKCRDTPCALPPALRQLEWTGCSLLCLRHKGAVSCWGGSPRPRRLGTPKLASKMGAGTRTHVARMYPAMLGGERCEQSTCSHSYSETTCAAAETSHKTHKLTTFDFLIFALRSCTIKKRALLACLDRHFFRRARI